MKIQKLEQSAFIFEIDSGFRLALDIGNKTPIESISQIDADAFLVSHLHGDHFSPPHIDAVKPRKVFMSEECFDLLGSNSMDIMIIKSGDSLQIHPQIEIEAFSVDHGPNASPTPSENFGFLIRIDGKKIYFAGDMYYESGINVSTLEVDIALIPVGGYYTFGPTEAYAFVRKFRKIGKIITMHYDKDPESNDRFIGLASDEFELDSNF